MLELAKRCLASRNCTGEGTGDDVHTAAGLMLATPGGGCPTIAVLRLPFGASFLMGSGSPPVPAASAPPDLASGSAVGGGVVTVMGVMRQASRMWNLAVTLVPFPFGFCFRCLVGSLHHRSAARSTDRGRRVISTGDSC